MGSQEEQSFVPQWKKELLERRRVTGRGSGVGFQRSERVVHGCSKHRESPSHSSLDFHPDSNVRTMRLLDSNLSELIVSGNSGIKCEKKMVEEKPVKKASFRDKHKKLGALKNGKDEDYQSDSSEELQYGPGIVNKLKSKYLSMTLRDNQKYSSRPSLSNLRRATSLENMLEDDAKASQKPHFVKKPYQTPKSPKISQHHAKYLGLTRGSESMKRARSMDTLIKNEKSPENKLKNGIRPSIINEDLVIVDNNQDEGKHKDRELPPPDLVKQTLKIFEPAKNEVKKMNKSPNTSPKNSPIKLPKPLLSPKPVLIPENRLSRPKILSPKRIFPVVTKEVPKSPVKEISSPKKEKALVAPIKFTPLAEKPPIVPLKTPAVVEKFEKSVEKDDDAPKYVSQKAMESIGKEGTSITFTFSESLKPNKNYLPSLTQATNTALIQNQPEVVQTSPQKQVAVIRPVVTNKPTNLTELEIEKNLINKVKSEPVKIANKNEIDTKIVGEIKTQLWDKKPWQNPNTMVFNFSGRQSVPDYIENDGLNLSPRNNKVNGKDEGDGSADEEDDPSTVCNVRFVGDNVLINGKSNLRKEPKENKQRKIQFNDEATTLFEYPSEESMKEDAPTPPAVSSAPNSPTLPTGGPNLASYTPSKTVGRNTFELGVTRVKAPSTPPPPPPTSTAQTKEDYLKPVDPNQETAWSQETTADILF